MTSGSVWSQSDSATIWQTKEDCSKQWAQKQKRLSLQISFLFVEIFSPIFVHIPKTPGFLWVNCYHEFRKSHNIIIVLTCDQQQLGKHNYMYTQSFESSLAQNLSASCRRTVVFAALMAKTKTNLWNRKPITWLSFLGNN